MTRDDIIRLAQAVWSAGDVYIGPSTESLERFAALVTAAERERMDLNAIHSCHAECQNPFCVRVREAVAHEREACAKLCDQSVDAEYATGKVDHNEIAWTQFCAIAIRARGNTGIKWEVEP